MINYLKLSIIFFAFASCKKQGEQSMEKAVTIPKLELLADNQGFGWQQDVLFFKGKPYSGYVLKEYPNRHKAALNAYFKGKLEGVQEKWFENGTKMEVRHYADNRKVGRHEGWYENGRKRYEYFIENDIPIKSHREWYSSGQPYSLFNYDSQGQPEGEQKMWYETGQIKSNYVIKEGRRFGFLGAKGCMGEGEKKQTGLNFKN
jgi:antitoxin component YwqK of YwqJK toxin-antitoxin module